MGSTNSDNVLRQLALAALAAPSADNRHRFKLGLDVDGTVHLTDSSDLFAGMPRHRQFLTLFSLGAVVENIILRASQMSLRAEVDWFPRGQGTLVAAIGLTHDPELAASELAPAIASRHTNRKMYHGPSLTRVEREALDAAGSRDGVVVEWLTGPRRRKVHRLIWMAETERFMRRALHEELFSSIRFDLDWTVTADDGLPPGALEVEAPMRPLFKALRSWPLMRRLNWLGTHHMLGLRAGLLPALQAPELAVISSALPWVESAVECGQAFQCLWLRAQVLGLAIQPMAASAVLALQDDVADGIRSNVRQDLLSGWTGVLGERQPVMVFRTGRALAPGVRASRPDPREVIRGLE